MKSQSDTLVRCILYHLEHQRPADPQLMLDPVAAPAQELTALYHERWQVESVFDELKTRLLQGRRV